MLSYMNNLAHVCGLKKVFNYSYYVGTFSEYDIGVIPSVVQNHALHRAELGGGRRWRGKWATFAESPDRGRGNPRSFRGTVAEGDHLATRNISNSIRIVIGIAWKS